MKILVADDSKPIRTMLHAILAGEGHEIVLAEDGEQALACMLKEDAPGMAIIDWHMPKLDGVEVCRGIRAQPVPNPPYLVMLTVKTGRAEILEGLGSGADDYVTKPFDVEALIARVGIGERILRLQATLTGRVRELEQSNQELEAFGRMVAHDLKNPLGAIEAFADLLKDEVGTAPREELLAHVTEIGQASAHAREIVDDLLKLSRAALSELKHEDLDLGEIAAGTARALAHSDPAREVEWNIGPELQVSGDHGLLRLALENLLRNAWKFSARRQPASISVGCLGDPGHRIFFVRDNGAGFDMKKAGKLFGAFQRLHSQRDFDGTGIGLTIVKRIIERHGGRIWAQSAVDQGATFFFTLGDAPAPVPARETMPREAMPLAA